MFGVEAELLFCKISTIFWSFLHFNFLSTNLKSNVLCSLNLIHLQVWTYLSMSLRCKSKYKVHLYASPQLCTAGNKIGLVTVLTTKEGSNFLSQDFFRCTLHSVAQLFRQRVLDTYLLTKLLNSSLRHHVQPSTGRWWVEMTSQYSLVSNHSP